MTVYIYIFMCGMLPFFFSRYNQLTMIYCIYHIAQDGTIDAVSLKLTLSNGKKIDQLMLNAFNRRNVSKQ